MLVMCTHTAEDQPSIAQWRLGKQNASLSDLNPWKLLNGYKDSGICPLDGKIKAKTGLKLVALLRELGSLVCASVL